MTFHVGGNAEYIDKAQKKSSSVKNKINEVTPVVKEKIVYVSHSFVRSLSVLIAVFCYYFFSGMTVLFRGKLPKGYKIPKKEEIEFFIHMVENPTEAEKAEIKEKKKYGQIVDLDYPIPNVNLLK
ncbi:MAG: hypothetical protein M1445_08455 [Bacteroidetes bacterium]|nr:hypothetical protein [Bacteroidota bacterium]